MDEFLDRFGKLCVQDGFVQGMESLLIQLGKIEEKAPLDELPADEVIRELRKQIEKTVSDLKPILEKQWDDFKAEHSKENSK
ncbi:MAG: hypothetical protein IKA32_07675 [Lentisphaeria bacterium]|nr:hypothetical protein [Lentisphaeria bacterium]